MYKVSRYNIYYKNFVFNTGQRSLIKAEEKVLNALQNNKLDILKSELLRTLHALGVIVDSNIDEIELFKFWLKNLKYNKRILNITYIPGYRCNSACKYCYASLLINKTPLLKEPNNDAMFVKWIETAVSLLKPLKLEFSFHGGEPLLYLKRILHIAKAINSIGEKHNIEIEISIVTNGTRLDLDTVNLLQSINIRNILVTVDGPEEIHDFRRPLKNGQGTFNLIIKNIKYALDAGINVVLSQNVDTHNYKETDHLLEILRKNNFHSYSNFRYVIAAVRYGPGYTELEYFKSYTPLEHDTYAKVKIHAYKTALKYGFRIALPIGTSICTLKQINSMIIDTYGNIYKCVTLTGDDEAKIGTIFDPLEVIFQRFIHFDKMEPWKNRDECLGCVYLPLCHGSCPQQAKINFPQKPLGSEVNCIKRYLDSLFPDVIEIMFEYNKRFGSDDIPRYFLNPL